VTFAYPDIGRPALAEVSVEIRSGCLVLLTGPSGAGMSTIARLLVRFADPSAGRVLLDSRDLRDYTLSALRRSVTLLPQETTIVEGTVAENIAYGTAAGPRRIRAATRAAQAEGSSVACRGATTLRWGCTACSSPAASAGAAPPC
jgi:ATP-binding cassette, subfamily B, bacterial